MPICDWWNGDRSIKMATNSANHEKRNGKEEGEEDIAQKLWFEQLGPLDVANVRKVKPHVVEEKKKLAEKVLSEETSELERRKTASNNADDRWMRTVVSSGTTADKVAAMTLMVQEAPILRLRLIDQLISMASRKSKREAQMAIETLKDLFMNTLLPKDRKLKLFKDQPLTHNKADVVYLKVTFV